MYLPVEYVWRGYRFRRAEGKEGQEVLRCVHRDVTMELSESDNAKVLVASIRSSTFSGYGEGATEGQALANCLMALRNVLKREIKAGKQAQSNLDRIRSMF